MPLFMDRHDAPSSTAEEVARNHAADIEVAPEFGVNFLSYWHDADKGLVFCFAEAPDEDAMEGAHAASHGDVPAEIIEVSQNDVVRFLGKISEPADASEITSAFRTICFTDLVDSTKLLDQLGQAQYMLVLTQHDLLVRESLVKWRGREVKHTGDGFMVSFDDAETALAWATDVRNSFDAKTELQVRIGMDAGEPVDQGDDLFGEVVTKANRICGVALPQTIYVSHAVREEAPTFEFDEGKLTQLKGFSDEELVYELRTDGST